MADEKTEGVIFMALDSSTKVLIVDDFELMRVTLRKALADLGLKNITEAVNGKQALTLLREAWTEKEPYKLVFLDWNMPKLSGIQLLTVLQEEQDFSQTIFIMLTAEAERAKVMDALLKGASDYIVKPCSVEKLKKKLVSLDDKLSRVS